MSFWIPTDLALGEFFVLVALSFASSAMTVAMGIGGGALLLAVMASIVPPAALIPVHGLVQLGSNAFRLALMVRHVNGAPILGFLAGTIGGAALGGSVVVSLPPGAVLIAVGCFVIYSVLTAPPAWLSRQAVLTGAVSSFLTMFFGATGVFVANFVKSLSLARQDHVATHAALMTLQHLAKVFAFSLLGFAFSPWAGFIVAMIAAGFLGTLAGRAVLARMSDHNFKRVLDIVLVLIALRLIWTGLTGAS